MFLIDLLDKIDSNLYLLGDEDGGVGLNCVLCDRGGLPIAYYANANDKSYEGTDVVVIDKISALFNEGASHLNKHLKNIKSSKEL